MRPASRAALVLAGLVAVEQVVAPARPPGYIAGDLLMLAAVGALMLGEVLPHVTHPPGADAIIRLAQALRSPRVS